MAIKSVIKCLPTLQKLSKAKSRKKRKELLSKCNRCIYYAISEVARNTVKGNIPLSPKRKKQLSPYKNQLRRLARKSGVSLKERKTIINQRGGFLPGLLIPALSILANVAADKLIK
jgi:hypothetical protein